MSRAWCTGLLAATALLLCGTEATAVYQCGNQKDDCKCNKNNPYPCCNNGGNCTWWAWESACCHWKVALPGWGNAKQWAGNAKANPSYDVRKTPVAGSIGVRVTGYYGHVVWVKSVSGSTATVSEMNCCSGCNYGMRSKTYSASYFDGGFIVRKQQCACSPGATQSQSCGKCGKQKRSCGSNCQWGSWGSCSGGGACAPGKSESQSCGNCGTRKRSCGSKCQWGAWGSCGGQGACAKGNSESQPCGNCGSRKRSCGSKCQWGAWASCSGQGCEAGTVQTQACGHGGKQRRSCSGQGCQWGTWGPCSSADGGGQLPEAALPAGDGSHGDLPQKGSAPDSHPGLQGDCSTGGGGRGMTCVMLLLLLCLARRFATS